jgi:hypothetical protein
MPVYPITFSIPESKIIERMPNKTKFVSNLIPGDLSTYIYNTEEEYYNEYKSSLFATTTKKGGWDCMRHYEILACGAIPYFPNIDNCPENTMALLPKKLIKSANILFEEYKNKEINPADIKECSDLITSLLDYTRSHLTTIKMAKYVLNKSGNSNASKILYLSVDTSPDYLRCLTLHGFKELLGSSCHDFPIIPHIYKSENINYTKLYGKGISYTNLLSHDKHDFNSDLTIEDDILNKKYDLIIYGSYHRGMPYYNLVYRTYPSDKIILLCGEDYHNCNYNDFVNRGHHVFVRELH